MPCSPLTLAEPMPHPGYEDWSCADLRCHERQPRTSSKERVSVNSWKEELSHTMDSGLQLSIWAKNRTGLCSSDLVYPLLIWKWKGNLNGGAFSCIAGRKRADWWQGHPVPCQQLGGSFVQSTALNHWLPQCLWNMCVCVFRGTETFMWCLLIILTKAFVIWALLTSF